MSEFDFEPIRGLPEHLPSGERLLWQGSPAWRAVARHVLHVRAIGAYFIIVSLWRMGSGWAEGQPLLTIAISLAWLVALGALTVGFLIGVAWLIQRTTVYSITTQRVVLRVGIAFPFSLNVPYKIVESAALKDYHDGTGDIPLQLNGDGHMAYLHLWPHARPWQMRSPQPMLRCIPEPLFVTRTLVAALAATTATIQAPARLAVPEREGLSTATGLATAAR